MRLVHATPLDRDQRHTVFDRELPPALTIEPGARLRVETVDCFSNKIRTADQRFYDNDTMLRTTGDLNPVTGPIYVLGAAPGDLLVVEIEEIRLAADQPLVTILIPGLGGPTGRSEVLGALPADTRLCSLHDGRVEFPTSRGRLSLPVRPMVGSIGTAPAGAPFPSLIDAVSLSHS